MRFVHLVMAGATACLAANIGHAAEDGIYIGAAVGQATTDDTIGLGEFYDDTDQLEKFIVGWRPMDWFAIEASYLDLGAVTLNQSVPAAAPFRLEQDGWGVFAMGLWEMGAFDLFAKGGFLNSDADLTQTGSGGGQTSSVDEDTDFSWGLGVQFRFRKLATRIEYEQLTISNGERFEHPELVSLGITWTF
jgi:hypothetical protein